MTLAADIPLDRQQHIVLDEIPWDLYEHLLEVVGDRPVRITYFRGRIEIMSPLYTHERWKKVIARLVEVLSLELNIPMASAGSTTFRRKDEEAGLEPDECYYVQHSAAVTGKDRLDLPADPPPDLAIEIDITRRSIPRQPIYAAFGVPELWRFDGKKLEFMNLDQGRRYQPVPQSLAFPFLRPADLQRFLDRIPAEDEFSVLRDFQQWVRTLPT